MDVTDAESQAQPTRANKNRLGESKDHTRRERRARENSSKQGSVSSRTVGATRKGASLSIAITGGILNQLIKQAEGRLEKAKACVEWYQNEELEAQRELEELKQLQELERQESEKQNSPQDE